MENVHKSSLRPWISSRICVKEFKEEWSAELLDVGSNVSLYDDKELADIKRVCGLNELICSFQSEVDLGLEAEISEDINLETLRQQKVETGLRKNNQAYDDKVYRHHFMFSNYPPNKIAGFRNISSSENVKEKVQSPEVILNVQIFQPVQRPNPLMKHWKLRQLTYQVDQEFLVLGSQYLTELRDKIECISDDAVKGDLSDHRKNIPDITCKDLYKSSFFYIDGTFYNDSRHPDCKDYSETIITWSQLSHRGIGPFDRAVMEKTRFEDLNIQLGYPYVFLHQGYCEHIIVFTDLLMHSRHYSQDRSDYPAYVSLKEKSVQMCMVCSTFAVEWVVYDNIRLPENPFLFCKECYLSFNYEEDGTKIGSFKSYHLKITKTRKD